MRLRKDMIGWQPEGDRSKSPGPAKTQYLRVPFLHFEALTVWISILRVVPRSYGGLFWPWMLILGSGQGVDPARRGIYHAENNTSFDILKGRKKKKKMR